jgi:hypothetical protein
VLDIAERMRGAAVRENELANYVLRLEAIRDFCDEAVKKTPPRPMFEALHQRKAATGKNSK